MKPQKMKNDCEEKVYEDDGLLSSIEQIEASSCYTRVESALVEAFAQNLERIAQLGGRRFLVYGAGMAGEAVVEAFKAGSYQLEFVGFLDRNTAVKAFCGRPVFNPNDPKAFMNIDAVILCAYESEPEMERKLREEIFPALDFSPPIVLRTASSETYDEYCQRFISKNFLKKGSSSRHGELTDAIVFIALGPYYNLLRHSAALRGIGLKTVLVTQDMKLIEEQGDYFDKVLIFTGLSDIGALNENKILGVHVQNWVSKNYFPVAVKKILDKPAVCEFQDLSCFVYEPHQLYRFAGLDQERFDRDLFFEKAVFQNYAAVLLPYTNAVVPKLAARGYPVRSDRFFYYPPPPCDLFFSDTHLAEAGELPKLLFIGGVPPDHSDDRLHHDAKMHTVMVELLREGFQIKILNNPKIAGTQAAMQKLYPFFCDLSRAQKGFHFEIGSPPETLKTKSAGWHFGLMLYDFSKVRIDKAHFDHMVPSKFFTYLEVGLPVLVSRKLRAVADLVEENGVGIVVEDGGVAHLSRIMQGWQEMYPKLVNNVKKFRDACEGKRSVKILLSAYRKAGMRLDHIERDEL